MNTSQPLQKNATRAQVRIALRRYPKLLVHSYGLGRREIGVARIPSHDEQCVSVCVHGPHNWIGRNVAVILAGYRDSTGVDARYLGSRGDTEHPSCKPTDSQ